MLSNCSGLSRSYIVDPLASLSIRRTQRNYGTGGKARSFGLGLTKRIKKHVSSQSVRVISDESVDAMESDTVADDYYSILGLSPQATPKEIRKAYRKTIKHWHPDQSTDDLSNDFAIFLNHVYETLIDPDSRAEYDVISGISLTAKNPFKDDTYPAEYAFVDEFSCIGCRLCNNICPKTFGMEEEHGRARVMQQGVDSVANIQESIDSCPVNCIHWVSAPQLTLLEEVMARMERIDAWILMNGGGKGANLNVFFEASLVWEKRHSARLAKQEAARWNWWGKVETEPSAWSRTQNTATSSEDFSSDEGYDIPPRSSGRRVTAGQMAAAARRWRDYQRNKRTQQAKLLPNQINSRT